MASYSAKLEAMMSGSFVDAGTRAVFINFFTFNPSTGIVGAIQLLCEFTPNGLVTSALLKTCLASMLGAPLARSRCVADAK